MLPIEMPIKSVICTWCFIKWIQIVLAWEMFMSIYMMVYDACDRLVMMIATSRVQFKCLRGSVFFLWEPFGWVAAAPHWTVGPIPRIWCHPKNFQEFGSIQHKFCLSCGFCAGVAIASIAWSNQIRDLRFIYIHPKYYPAHGISFHKSCDVEFFGRWIHLIFLRRLDMTVPAATTSDLGRDWWSKVSQMDATGGLRSHFRFYDPITWFNSKAWIVQNISILLLFCLVFWQSLPSNPQQKLPASITVVLPTSWKGLWVDLNETQKQLYGRLPGCYP